MTSSSVCDIGLAEVGGYPFSRTRPRTPPLKSVWHSSHCEECHTLFAFSGRCAQREKRYGPRRFAEEPDSTHFDIALTVIALDGVSTRPSGQGG